MILGFIPVAISFYSQKIKQQQRSSQKTHCGKCAKFPEILRVAHIIIKLPIILYTNFGNVGILRYFRVRFYSANEGRSFLQGLCMLSLSHFNRGGGLVSFAEYYMTTMCPMPASSIQSEFICSIHTLVLHNTYLFYGTIEPKIFPL